MSVLPALNGRKVVKVFESFGWEVVRQRGSHIILVKENHNVTLSVPVFETVADRSSSPFTLGVTG